MYNFHGKIARLRTLTNFPQENCEIEDMDYGMKALSMSNSSRTVSEVYSPPRVTEEARKQPQYGILPGFALDLSNGWDFDRPEMRRKARGQLRKRRRPARRRTLSYAK